MMTTKGGPREIIDPLIFSTRQQHGSTFLCRISIIRLIYQQAIKAVPWALWSRSPIKAKSRFISGGKYSIPRRYNVNSKRDFYIVPTISICTEIVLTFKEIL